MLPAVFARAWSFTLRLPAWRMEVRNQGAEAIPSKPCRLMHFQSQITDCTDATTNASLVEHGATGIHGFIGDPTWTNRHNNERRPERRQFGDVIMGYGTEFSWSIGANEAAEFDPLWDIVASAGADRSGLAISLRGHKATMVNADRDERLQVAPIRSYSLYLDRGGYIGP